MIGGHVLAQALSVALVVLASGAWPMSRADAALAAMLLSFPLWTGAIMWAFAARSAFKAWAVLTLLALPASLLAWMMLRAQGSFG